MRQRALAKQVPPLVEKAWQCRAAVTVANGRERDACQSRLRSVSYYDNTVEARTAVDLRGRAEIWT